MKGGVKKAKELTQNEQNDSESLYENFITLIINYQLGCNLGLSCESYMEKNNLVFVCHNSAQFDNFYTG